MDVTSMKKFLVFIAIIFILAAGWYLASPLFIDKTVDEDLPLVMMTKEENDESVAILKGSFTDADNFHKGSGEAQVYKLPDGTQLLRFENFTVTNGPDLRVLLAVDGDPANAIELGKLKGNIGDQNYDIPSDTDISTFNSVLIYCKPFQVIFSTATLSQL